MFFFETSKLFFDKNSRKDLLGLIVGLVAIFTFANVMMPDWPFIFFIAAMMFSSAVYRFVMVDEMFVKNDNDILKRDNVVDFVISKNSFVLFFSTALFLLVIIISSMFDNSFLSFNSLVKILTYNLFILGSDNIIYILHNKPVEGYASGFKRDEMDDIRIGFKNFVDQLPSLIMILIFVILFFILDFEPSIYYSIYYYMVCVVTLTYFMKLKLSKIDK
ncbi:hypothetical protein LZ578_02630 [Jeotgalibaca sp. MA1X17-3]|uniref:hypothetical protein n=1 Tax=Jeotgalibaca sp. MA1X17-3 TaxID=2908211 RepID=UPI001F174A5C|nr:hypothetical protein [Jeotgalibaca sp. MA1X17-3]UJF16055.1 hypothetical protein LZ578_02630 [Jeotgalibaca sp. MA1X17-3]